MLGLSKKNDNLPGLKACEEAVRAAKRKVFRQRVVRTTMVPRMVGSMMVLVPWREDGGAEAWSDATQTND